VWADTFKIGCGFTAFASSDGWYKKLYVCNYGPGGNIVGGSSSMYKTRRRVPSVPVLVMTHCVCKARCNVK
jgi:hypothetical protein